MTADKIITVWHINDDADGYTREVFCASVYTTLKSVSDNGGTKASEGMRKSNILKARIPTKDQMPLSIGDYVRVGRHTGSPIRGKDFKIVELADNRKGANPHWRISAE